MNMIEYELGARQTAVYQGKGTFGGVVYNALKLAGEAGEIADKVGKLYGKGATPTPDQVADLTKEMGDVLWHLTNMGIDLSISLSEIGQTNLSKLQSRQERGVIVGDGDNR